MTTATKDSTIQLKVDPALKARAAQIADDMGMNLSTLISVYLKRVVADRAIPFPLCAPSTPNACTIQAFEELRAGKGEHFDNAEEALKSLGM